MRSGAQTPHPTHRASALTLARGGCEIEGPAEGGSTAWRVREPRVPLLPILAESDADGRARNPSAAERPQTPSVAERGGRD